MTRPISSTSLTKLGQKTGIEPINIIAIEWVEGTVTKYADKRIPGIAGLITRLSDLDEVMKLDSSASVASIDIELDDTDGQIKDLMDTHDLHKRECIVYQYFSGIPLDDAFELFRGQIHSPIEWTEGGRAVSFTVHTKVFTVETGFAPEEGQFNEIPIELTGRAWPLGFGEPVHVPGVKASETKTTSAMFIGGVPDATLPLKKEILEYRLTSITEAYDYYMTLINTAQGIEVTGQQLQWEYANFIIGSDLLKQTFEDLNVELEQVNQQIEELIAQWNDSDPDGADRTDIDSRLTTLRGHRDDRVEVITGLRRQVEMLSYQQDVFEIRNDNLKFEITFVNRLRKQCIKLREHYYRFFTELTQVKQAISQQQTTMSASLPTSSGYRFTQNSTINVVCNNVTLSGIFTNNIFTIGAVQPSYTGLKVGARQDNSPDTLWLESSNINLLNMYILSDTGYIAKVIRQEGNKIQIQLPKRNKKTRSKARAIDYSGDADTKAIFDATLSRLVTGPETPTQVAQIANTLPKGINPKVWKLLRGNGETVTIRIKVRKYDPNDTEYNSRLFYSTFVLQYGDFFITEPIGFNETESSIKSKIVNCTDVLPDDSVKVTIVQTLDQTALWVGISPPELVSFTELKIELNGLTPYQFSLFDVKLSARDEFLARDLVTLEYDPVQGNSAIVSLELGGLPVPKAKTLVLGGKIDFYFCGKCFSINQEEFNFTAQSIVDQLEADGIIETGEMTASGEWSTVTNTYEDLVFTFNEKLKTLYVDSSEVEILGYDSDDVLNKNILGKPKITTYYYGGYASEKTKKQNEKILNDAAEKIPIAPGIKKFKEKILELVKLRKQQLKDGEQDNSVEQAISRTMHQLSQILMKVQKSQPDEYAQIISDAEYKLLYDMEMSAYLQFVSQVNLLDEEFTEDETYEFTAKDFDEITEACPIIIPRWLERVINTSDKHKRLQLIEALPRSTEGFYIDVGELLVDASAYQEKYIVNLLPSTVLSVYGHRTVQGIKRFVPIPSSYYVVNASENYGGYNCTSVTLAKSLKWFDPSWEEDIFVTYTSSVGPNVVDVIEWLITAYTNLTVDTATFTHVRTLQDAYPVNFALLDKRNTLQLVEDIAWQARCVTWVSRGKVYIRYVPEELTAVKTITEDDVGQSSLKLTFTESEQLVTTWTAKWRLNYSQSQLYSIVVRRNVKKYEEVKDEREFFIYNNRELVYKSITFWMMRRASTWKRVQMTLYLNHLDIETQDTIELDFDANHFTTGPVKAIVEQAVYNSENNLVNVSCWLPVLAGQMTPYVFAWPKDLTVNDIFPLAEEVIAGNAGNPINIQVPSGDDYDPYDPTILDQRPKDFGTAKLGDVGDTTPSSLASELTQLDYDLESTSEIGLSEEQTEEQDILDFDLANFGAPLNSSKSPENGPLADLYGKTTIGRILEVFEYTVPREDTANNQLLEDITISTAKILISDGRVIIAQPFNQTVFVSEGDKVLIAHIPGKQNYGGDDSSFVYFSPTMSPAVRR